MRFTHYQAQAAKTAIFPPDHEVEYLTLGLTSEAGEVAGKIKKLLRDQDRRATKSDIEQLSFELGDVLWYVAMLAAALGLNLDTVAHQNLLKLAHRKVHGKLGGSGDSR